MELRVVSLPPTISRIRFPRYSIRSMLLGGFAVGQHGDQIGLLRRVHPLVPQAS